MNGRLYLPNHYLDLPIQERGTELERKCNSQHLFHSDRLHRSNIIYTQKANDCTHPIVIKLEYVEVAPDDEHNVEARKRS